MSIFDEAKAIDAMIKKRRLSREDIAKMMGVSRSCVANKLRLLTLSEEEQKMISDAGLTERHARAVLRMSRGEERKSLVKRICKEKPTVAVTEALVDLARTSTAPHRIGQAEKLGAIYSFTDSLKESVNTLRSLQIDANYNINFYENKTYITIRISEK